VPFSRRADEELDARTKSLFRLALELLFKSICRDTASKDDVAALKQRRPVLEAERRHELAEIGHADDVQASEVDCPKQRDAGRHGAALWHRPLPLCWST